MSKNPAAVRKATVRKNLQKHIRALNKIEVTLAKAQDSIRDNSENLPDMDTFEQLSAVYEKIGIAITICDSARQETAHKLVNAYIISKK
jgi:DNA transposition AAA+ family ATPase